MRSGGVSRYVPNRWGVVTGKVTNFDEQPSSALIVVTPAGSNGLQFARKLELPGRMSFESVWPVRIGGIPFDSAINFEYLYFPDGEDDGIIRHRENEREIPSFTGISQRDSQGLSGLIGDSQEVHDDESVIHQMLGVMRYTAMGNLRVVNLKASELTANSESLDALDQLSVADSKLLQFPQVCDAIRLWVQRGGRLHLVLDRTGPAVAEALLGNSLPITVVGDTTTNSVTLDLNRNYPQLQYPTRSVTREFAEPVHYLRIQPDAGEVIWSVDGWPVALRIPYGDGVVLVTAISPLVFLDSVAFQGEGQPTVAMIASSRRLQESLFSGRNPPLIAEAAAAEAAAAAIGYQIPSRTVAAWLLLIFPACLLAAGIVLQRKSLGERLVFVLPGLAMLAAVPAAVVGFQIRSVAPTTMIETAVIHATPGATELAVAGFATTFVGVPTDLQVSSSEGARLDAISDDTNSDYRRMVWRSPSEVSWQNLQQPAGVKTYATQSVRQLKSPWRALAKFTENGLKGQLHAEEKLAVTDVMLAGVNRDNLTVTINDNGEFECTSEDRLAHGQFFRSTLLSDDQRFRSRLLKSVFVEPSKERGEPFPIVPSLVFWDTSETKALEFGDQAVRRQRSVLVVQPLEFLPPAPGELISIPPQVLTYRSIATANGGFGSVFANVKRQWMPQESGAETLLEFQLPKVCLPFAVDQADVELMIRAGSREVTIKSGEYDDLQQVAQFKSPLGLQVFSIPIHLIKSTCLSGKVLLSLNVSELNESLKASDMSGEQDDSWRIERVLLLLKGRRQP